MIRFFYTGCLYLSLPMVFIRLFWRSLKNSDYRKRWSERFAWYGKSAHKVQGNTIIIHAVSVGEVHAAVPLIKTLITEQPERQLVVTTSTPTGSARVRDLFKNKVLHVYLPYDLPGALRRFLARFSPALIVLMETELWPNLIHSANSNHIPVFLVNGRLSKKSLRGYSRLGSLTKGMLSKISWIAAQSEDDKRRFISLGMDSGKIDICGSLKYDIEVPKEQVQAGKKLRSEVFLSRPVVIAASTREGEDEQIISAFLQLIKNIPQAGLILVPRHLERFSYAEKIGKEAGFITCSKSQFKTTQENCQVLIGDTLGELFLYYSAADVAFVGGSLVPTGCQNILEPAALGLPIITGSSRYNFQSISDEMIQAAALKEVQDHQELAQAWLELLSDQSLALSMGQSAKKEFFNNSGASQAILTRIQNI